MCSLPIKGILEWSGISEDKTISGKHSPNNRNSPETYKADIKFLKICMRWKIVYICT
jgi:hypothetical protein